MANTELRDPEAKQAEKLTTPTDLEATEMCKQISGALGARKTWENKIREMYNRRYGIRKAKTFPWPGCYSYDTELLTESGWRPVSDVQIGDRVFARDPKTKKARWEEVFATTSPYYDELIHFQGKGVDLLVSPDHHMYLERAGVAHFVQAQDVKTGYWIPLCSEWEGEEPDEIHGFDAEDFAAFLGWYVAEGWTYDSGTIGVAQSPKSSYTDEIDDLLARMGFEFSYRDNPGQFLVKARNIAPSVRALLIDTGKCYDKKLPRFALNWSTTLLSHLLDAMMKGDGTRRVREGRLDNQVYYTASTILADQVQEIAQKIGMRATIRVRLPGDASIDNMGKVYQQRVPVHEVTICHKKAVKTSGLKRETVPYKERAYCVTVASHTLYVRRNGIPAWCGNCSNINIPLTDSRIRAIKPIFKRAVFSVTPIATFQPLEGEDPELCRRVESFYDWLVRIRMTRTRKVMSFLCDGFLQYGFGFIECTWKYKTERVTRKLDLSNLGAADRDQVRDEEVEQAAISQLGLNPEYEDDAKAITSVVQQFRAGKDFIEASLQKVVYDAPQWEYVPPWDVIVPWDAFDDVDRAPWLTRVLHMRPQELKDEAAQDRYEQDVVNDICKNFYVKKASTFPSTQMTMLEADKAIREGIAREEQSPNYIEVWRRYGWQDINGDGLDERVVTDFHAGTNKVLRHWAFPYDHGEWPLVKINAEDNEDRWYAARGYPELLWDLQDEINATHNMWIDRQVLTNALPFKYREGTQDNPTKLQPQPGSGIPVKRMDDFEMLNWPIIDFTFDSQERVLKAWADEYTGNPGLAFNNVVNRVERRTAREVDEISVNAEGIASDDVGNFQDGLSRLHWQTLRLWKQYGPEWVEVRASPKAQPIRVSKVDLDGKFSLFPTGHLENSNPAVRKQTLLNDMALAANPAISPYTNMWEMWRDYMEMSDYRGSQRYLRAPGLFEQDAAQQQYAEVIMMQAVRQPVDVNFSDPHDVHIAAIEQVIPAQQKKDPELVGILSAHVFMHMIAAGALRLDDPSLQQLAWNFVIVGNRVKALPKGAESV